MITEDYVSFETAKLLKEKGFNEGCLEYYAEERICDKKFINRNFSEEYMHNYENFTQNFVCVAPTLQMAMKWLREVYNKHIEIGYDILKWHYDIFDLKEIVQYRFDSEDGKSYNEESKCLHTEYNFNSYEEACEAAIKYCLENLI